MTNDRDLAGWLGRVGQPPAPVILDPTFDPRKQRPLTHVDLLIGAFTVVSKLNVVGTE